MNFWDAPGVLMTWQYWGVLVRYFVKWPSVEICLTFLSWLDRGDVSLKGHRGTGPFSSHCPEYSTSTWLITDVLTLIPWLRYVKWLSPLALPPILFSLERGHYLQPIFKDWGVMLHLLEGEYLHALFGILLYGSLSYSLLLYLIIIYLYQYERIDICFILWVIN